VVSNGDIDEDMENLVIVRGRTFQQLVVCDNPVLKQLFKEL